MTDAQLFGYLHVFWMTDKEIRRLAKHVGVKVPASRSRRPRRRR